jgi:hypothetical protein
MISILSGRRAAALLLAAGAALLGGCATSYRLDNSVQAFSTLGSLPPQPTYRFERLPSQAQQPRQAQIEALADPALFNAGLRRDDASPRFSVQVSARVEQVLSPWADPWWGGWGPGALWGPGPAWWGPGLAHPYHPRAAMSLGWATPFPRAEPPWWRREVGVLVRDIISQQVVFESRAVNDGPWNDSATVLSALFQAALNGFPNPPQGLRRVEMQVGGSQAPAPATGPAAASPGPGPAPAPAPLRVAP